jgi:hypothetical protein
MRLPAGTAALAGGKLRADHRLSAPRLNSHQGGTRQENERYHLHARYAPRLGTSLLLLFLCRILHLSIYIASHAAHYTNPKLPRCRPCGFQIPKVCCANMQLHVHCIGHVLTAQTEIGVAFCSGGRYAPTTTNVSAIQQTIDNMNRRSLSDGRCHDVF